MHALIKNFEQKSQNFQRFANRVKLQRQKKAMIAPKLAKLQYSRQFLPQSITAPDSDLAVTATNSTRPLRLFNKVVSVKTVSAPEFLPEASKATQPAPFGTRPFHRVRCTRPSRSIMAEAYPTIDNNGNIQRQSSCSTLKTPGAPEPLPTTTYQSTQVRLSSQSSDFDGDLGTGLKLPQAKHSRPTSTQVSQVYFTNYESNQQPNYLYISSSVANK